MFEIATDFMVQIVYLIPGYLGLYLIFDFLGSFFFGRN